MHNIFLKAYIKETEPKLKIFRNTTAAAALSMQGYIYTASQ